MVTKRTLQMGAAVSKFRTMFAFCPAPQRKATASFTLQMMLSLFLLFVVCALIAGMIYYYLNIKINTQQSEADLLVERLLSRNGILKIAPLTDAPVMMVIDSKKFAGLESLKLAEGVSIAARVQIGEELHYANQDFWMRIAPLFEAKLAPASFETAEAQSLKGGVFRYRYLVGLDEPTKPAAMTIVVVMHNE